MILLIGTTAFILSSLNDRNNNRILLDLADKLQLTAQRLSEQGMDYKKGSPQNKSAPLRESQAFYQELMAQMSTFDRILSSFILRTFRPDLTGLTDTLTPELSASTLMALDKVEMVWVDYRQGLLDAIGPDLNSPRFKPTADYIIANRTALEEAAEQFHSSYRQQISVRIDRIEQMNNLIITFALLPGLAIILLIFYRKRHALKPRA